MTPIGQKRVKQVNLQNSVFVNITAIFTASFFINFGLQYTIAESFIYTWHLKNIISYTLPFKSLGFVIFK